MPTRALWELEHDPDQWVFRIMTVRAYEQAKALVDSGKSEADLPKSAAIDLAIENRLDRMNAVFRNKLAAQKAKQRG